MFNNNRHLNIFEHYTQKGSLPVENNLSRGLAILLNQNNLVLDRFIDYVNAKCFEKKSPSIVSKPQRSNDKQIGIQQKITKTVQSYPDPQSIIGITLTTSSPINMIENEYDDNNSLITDIVIRCKDTLVVIEVKRNAADARLQLKQQVKSIEEEVVRQGGNRPSTELLDGTWEEVISILQDVYNISGSNEDSILGHYLNHLENYYQEWFPISLLNDIPIQYENEPAIDKRILSLIKNCCENESDSEKYSGRYIVPLDYDFCNQAQISMDYGSKRLMITVWSGDTKWQSHCLLNKTANDLSWVYEDNLTVDGFELELLTEPYLRLAHFQSTIIAEYFDKRYYQNNFGASKDKCKELYNDITREWKRTDWSELRAFLKGKYNGLIDMNSFDSDFKNSFENSNRSYAHVSFGYETTAYISMDVVSEYEKNNSTLRGSDKLASFISKTIDQLMNKIA
ncbi:hypothetical protein EUAN_02490 [Andreesenia angusta]|uniref:PD-(D/E)XK nuclease superfamily protein n=1 Tax=Andreesenia angusta TaxID=39480 RepID=A0A1S1VAE7_9FIRM|nr:PD-(D/E)XK nuclease family protein [Andreesenia angusta]OHW63385.1 hypothetical protein EUAN_02490 [Andreesenia angusta]